MAGFEVATHGRFWVATEAIRGFEPSNVRFTRTIDTKFDILSDLEQFFDSKEWRISGLLFFKMGQQKGVFDYRRSIRVRIESPFLDHSTQEDALGIRSTTARR